MNKLPPGDQGLMPNFGPVVTGPVLNPAGLFLTDIHGGTVMRGTPVSWEVSLGHTIPYVNHNGNGSQSMPDAGAALRQRQAAAGLGLFANSSQNGANYDTEPLLSDPSMSIHRFAIGDHVPGRPLGLTSSLGHRGG